MKVFVAGATGALGKQLVPRLVAAGHEVTGMTRSESKRDAVRALGAMPVVADALDPEAVARAVAAGRARGDRAPAHRPLGLARHAPFRPRLRSHQPAAHRGHRPPARRRPRGGRSALRGAELRRLAVRAQRRTGQDRGRPARPEPAAAMRRALEAIRHLEARGDRRGLDRGRRAPLRRLLRPGHVARRRTASTWRRSASASSRSSATARACGRSSTSRTPPRRRSRRSSAARAGSTTSSTTSPRRSPSGCRVAASALGAQAARGTVPRWLGRLLAGEAAAVMMTEVRGASNAKAKRELGWQPRHRAGGGFAEWRREPCHDELLDELRPAAFAIAYRMLGSVSEAEDVVQEALLRVHRALEDGRADRVAAGVRGDGRHPARHRRAALGPRAPRDLRRRVAPGAARGGRRGRPGAAGRDGRLAVARVPGLAREPLARAAGGLPAARRVRLRLRRDRAHRGQERGEHPPARRARAARTWRSGGRASRPSASSATSWPSASSPPRGTATSTRSRRCSPRTSSCTATAAARRRRWPARCTAASAVARTLVAWARRARGSRRRRSRRVEVNGQPGALLLDAEER